MLHEILAQDLAGIEQALPWKKRKRTGAMIPLKERFIVDENGQRVGVLLDIEDYRPLLEDIEELEAIRAYDAAQPVP